MCDDDEKTMKISRRMKYDGGGYNGFVKMTFVSGPVRPIIALVRSFCRCEKVACCSVISVCFISACSIFCWSEIWRENEAGRNNSRKNEGEKHALFLQSSSTVQQQQ